MPKPFDATLKDMAAVGPNDFVSLLVGPTIGGVGLLNVDLSTVTTSADVAFGLGDPLESIVPVDAQAGASADLPANTLCYNGLLYRQYRVPVHSIILLLREKASHPSLTGAVRYVAQPGRGKMEFEFEVIRLWEWPVDRLLQGGLGTLPLAVLAKLPDAVGLEASLTAVVRQIAERLAREAPPETAKRLITAAYVLTGLRVDRELLRHVFQGVADMRESVAYQMILEEGEAQGRIKEAQRTILRLGRKRFGEPAGDSRERIAKLQDIELLEELSDRLLDVASWTDLLSVVPSESGSAN